MIDKFYINGEKLFAPVCDLCDKQLPPTFDFMDAVAAIRSEGWLTKKAGNSFENYCPDCAAMLNSARRDFED